MPTEHTRRDIDNEEYQAGIEMGLAEYNGIYIEDVPRHCREMVRVFRHHQTRVWTRQAMREATAAGSPMLPKPDQSA